MAHCPSCGDDHPDGTEICPRTRAPLAAGGVCGTRVDRYDVIRYLGGGGMGGVYSARHATVGHPVALKILHPQFTHDPDILQRFVREARTAASIGSPHILRMYDVGMAPTGVAFLAMELIDGPSLEALLQEQGTLSVGEAVDVAAQALEGLAAAHAVGVVHRDMKPANVLLSTVTEAGLSRRFVKLVDFGIAKIREGDAAQKLTRTGMLLGTPYYMAPEQFHDAHDVDFRADLYSVAVMLYQSLAGTVPFRARDMAEMIHAVLFETPRSLREIVPGIPPDLVHVLERGLARSVNDRWGSASEFAAAMRASIARVDRGALATRSTQFAMAPSPGPPTAPSAWAPPPSVGVSFGGSAPLAPVAMAPMGMPTVPVAKRSSTKGWIAGASALFVMFAALAGSIVWFRERDDGEPPTPRVAMQTPPAPAPSALPPAGFPATAPTDPFEADPMAALGAMMQQANTNPAMPAPTAPIPPSPDGAVVVESATLVGDPTLASMRQLFAAQQTQLQSCRGSQSVRVTVRVLISTNEVSLTVPLEGGDGATTACVAGVLTHAHVAAADGIATVIALVPRR